MGKETLVKIPALKTGLDFLASSHFDIGKESKWLSNNDPLAYKSTFKHDYLPLKGKKSKLADIPPPAGIMQKDSRCHEISSITRQLFLLKFCT